MTTDDDATALGHLKRYYGRDGGQRFTGSYFDGWGGPQDPYRFTAEDLVAVSFLSVFVPPMAAHRLLGSMSGEFADLLHEVGIDRDLRDETADIVPGWPAWVLYDRLKGLPGVGRTIASKLLARKRPQLIPVKDSIVEQVTHCRDAQWVPLREQLQADGGRLHERLERLRADAGLPTDVTALRVYDVITWMEGRTKKLKPRTDEEKLGAALADPDGLL
ncbi:DUF6308 family protein [Geodermatophilus sp. SYSU D00691]